MKQTTNNELSPSNLGYTIFDQVSSLEKILDTYGIKEPSIQVDYSIDSEDIMNIHVSAEGIERHQYIESTYQLLGVESEENKEIMYEIWIDAVEEVASELDFEDYSPLEQ